MKGMIKHFYSQALKESSMMRFGTAAGVSKKIENVKYKLSAIMEGKYDEFAGIIRVDNKLLRNYYLINIEYQFLAII
jgi:hypothetical protein